MADGRNANINTSGDAAAATGRTTATTEQVNTTPLDQAGGRATDAPTNSPIEILQKDTALTAPRDTTVPINTATAAYRQQVDAATGVDSVTSNPNSQVNRLPEGGSAQVALSPEAQARREAALNRSVETGAATRPPTGDPAPTAGRPPTGEVTTTGQALADQRLTEARARTETPPTARVETPPTGRVETPPTGRIETPTAGQTLADQRLAEARSRGATEPGPGGSDAPGRVITDQPVGTSGQILADQRRTDAITRGASGPDTGTGRPLNADVTATAGQVVADQRLSDARARGTQPPAGPTGRDGGEPTPTSGQTIANQRLADTTARLNQPPGARPEGGTNPPGGSTGGGDVRAQLAARGEMAAAARAGNIPGSDSSGVRAELAARGEQAAAARAGNPPGGSSAVRAELAARAEQANAARAGKPTGGSSDVQAQLAARAEQANAARAGKPTGGSSEIQAQLAARAAQANAARATVDANLGRTPEAPRPSARPEAPVVKADGPPAVVDRGKPGGSGNSTQVQETAATPKPRRVEAQPPVTSTVKPAGAAENLTAAQQRRAEALAARQAVGETLTPAQQKRADALAAKRAGPEATTTPAAQTAAQRRAEAVARLDAGTADAGKKGRGADAAAPGGDPLRVNRRGDGTATVPPERLADLRRAQAEARLGRGRGDRGDGSQQPLDARQQKWLSDQVARMGDQKGQNFKQNFERLSSQNRDALMNMDGRKQMDMIGKMSRERVNLAQIDGKLSGRGATGDGMDQTGKGKPGTMDGGKALTGDLARLQRLDGLKIAGLDARDPAARQFLTDANNRFNQLKLDGANANMKLSDALKGLDPQKVSALEKFLSGNANMEPGKLTLGQLDQTRLTLLQQNVMRGSFGLALTPQESFRLLSQQLGQNPAGRGALADIGRTLNDMGLQPGSRLSDLVSRTLGARSPGAGGTGFDIGLGTFRSQTEFSARLNPLQELNIRNLLDNTGRLSTLLDSSFSRMDFTQGHAAAGKAIGLAQILATTLGDSRGDFAVRGDLGRGMHGITDAGTPNMVQERGDYASHTSGKSQEYIAKLPIDAATGLPFDPSTGKLLDPSTGRPIGDRTVEAEKKSQKRDGEDEDMDEKDEKKKRKADSDVDQEKAKQKAMLLLLQARKKRERELQEKALKDEKRKEEDEKRVKYICKDGDTVQSIALKQLRDSRIAALIYQINKEAIPVRIVNGEQVPVLHAGLIIWLPSPKEIREFRTKLVSSTSAPPQGEQFASAEDELAAKFGADWSGAGQESATPEQNSIERKLMEDAMAEAKRRRENIEKALGPIAAGGAGAKVRSEGGNLIYQVRLGDTLRSVATKHPSIGDVNLWRLLAEVNEISTEVDAKGHPKAGLARGSKIKIPNAQEILDYRQRVGSMAGQPLAKEQRVSKTCRACGRINVQSATLCPGCGYEFDVERAPAAATPAAPEAPRDAGTIVLEAINVQKPGGLRTEDLDAISPSDPTTRVGQSTHDLDRAVEQKPPARPEPVPTTVEQVWAACKDFDPQCRLAKSAHSFDTANGKLHIQLQLREEQSDWYPILEYEIFASYSIRHTYSRQARSRKTVKIDLPAPAAMELAQNDLLANWNNYKNKYFSQQ